MHFFALKLTDNLLFFNPAHAGGMGEGGLAEIRTSKLSINQPMNLEIKFYCKMYIPRFPLCTKAKKERITILNVTQNMTKK